jgi:hypothetical protein
LAADAVKNPDAMKGRVRIAGFMGRTLSAWLKRGKMPEVQIINDIVHSERLSPSRVQPASARMNLSRGYFAPFARIVCKCGGCSSAATTVICIQRNRWQNILQFMPAREIYGDPYDD